MNKIYFAIAAISLILGGAYLMTPTQSFHHGKGHHVQQLLKEWTEFKYTYEKEYSSAEEEMFRFNVFKDNLKYINENQGDTYTLGVNFMTDLTNEEFKAIYLGYKVPENYIPLGKVQQLPESVEYPASVNWVQAGITPPIQNQGQCGSCWAFSAAESLSSAWNMKNGGGNSILLSMEQLVQCSQAYGNAGCNGGMMDNAFNYTQSNPLCTFAQYPYTSGNGITGNCNNVLQSQGSYSLSSWTNVAQKNTTALYVANAIQPVSIAVDASKWQNYKSGIFKNCGQNLDHGVLLVGYTSTYWYVQNSWGTTWGMNGYIQLAPGNTCGLIDAASYPSV